MNKFREHRSKSQVKPQQITNFESNAEHIVSQWPLRARRLLTCLGTADRVYKDVRFRQLKLAKNSGYSVRQVQRWLDYFRALGLISTTYRHMRTSIYRVHPILHTPTMKARLRRWLYPLSLSLALVASSWGVDPATAKDYSKNVVQDICNNNVYEQTVTVSCIDSRELRWRRLEKLKKRRATMDTSTLVLLLDEVRHTTRLPLTDYGAAKLLAFPQAILEQATREYHAQANKNDPYALFYGICKRLCREAGEEPNQSKSMYVISKCRLKVTDGNFARPVEKAPQKGKTMVSRFNETSEQKRKCDEVLRRSQARIKARNRGLEKGTPEYEAFVNDFINASGKDLSP